MPDYSESSVRVLEGLEPVRMHPSMYTRIESPLHIIQEIIDNAADEALGGYATYIHVELHEDGSVSVEDDGRGVPVGPHPIKLLPVVELVYTVLHAGGKFDKSAAASAYRFSGGLHGVGVSVTNALSLRMEVSVKREGGHWSIAFEGGAVADPLKRLGKTQGHGTKVTVWPDGRFFDDPKIPKPGLLRVLRSKAVLLPGLTVVFKQGSDEQTWRYAEGAAQYLAESVVPLDEEATPVFLATSLGKPGEEGADLVIAFPSLPFRESYANLVHTPLGGTHDSGIREGLFSALKSFMELHALLPKGARIVQDDFTGILAFLVSARVVDPQFQGQTKDKLLSRDTGVLLSGKAEAWFATWLNQHLAEARALSERVASKALSRARIGQRVTRRRSTGTSVLPGKLADCESTDIERNEVIIVEGDSAGGGARQSRDKNFQAILPIRGKVLNTWEVAIDKLLANKEAHDIAVALGVDPHLPGAGDLSGLRYGKFLILADADVDGSHIQVLLLTLLLRHFPDLVTSGHVYVVQPPLYRVDTPGKGKAEPGKHYAKDDRDKAALVRKLVKAGFKEESLKVSRFKGLGEMMPLQLWETALNPDTRTLVRIQPTELAETEAIFGLLMGKNEAAGRRAWMREHGHETEGDV